MALTLIVFSAGTVIKSADVNSNFSAINSKLFDLKNENINASAAIVDTKLATIATANKVNGSAMVAETINGVKGQFFWGLGGVQVDTTTNVSFEYEPTCNLDITGVELRCKTAPSGGVARIDINKDGTTIFGTPPEINDGAFVDSGGAALNVTTLAAGDVLTVDVDLANGVADVSVILKVTQKVPQ